MNTEIRKIINLWAEKAIEDDDLAKEYALIKNDEDKLYDAFYKELTFGTAGLRGVIGFGPNRMNIYVIRKVTQGLANYLINNYSSSNDIKVAIGYDSRIKSDVFAKEAAKVLASNNIKVELFDTLSPVPILSYATRELSCKAGIMITASHNPSKYNGYKVYNEEGCQITDVAANKIYNEILKVNPFDVRPKDFNYYLRNKIIHLIDDKFFDLFINRVKKESVLGNEKVDRNVKIIYSPLHGAGLVPVTRILKESGFNNVKIVEEQRLPDGNFTTCPYPNPEIREAMELGIKYAKENDADLLIATDPDCDRVGIAVKDKDDFVLLTGNQTGVLLLNYILELRSKNKTMPKDATIVKTIVTTDMADTIASFYGVKVKSLLTGFKYIGEFIKSLEDEKKESSYIFGFEESYGYLTGSYVRDKDAVDGSLMIAEMFAYYKSHGISLIQKLDELYKKFGFYLNKLDNYQFEGAEGFTKMNQIMDSFRKRIDKIGSLEIDKINDYKKGIENLPKADVIKFFLKGNSTVTLRPSGTEPKLKLYCSIKAKDEKEAMKIYKEIHDYFDEKLR